MTSPISPPEQDMKKETEQLNEWMNEFWNMYGSVKQTKDPTFLEYIFLL